MTHNGRKTATSSTEHTGYVFKTLKSRINFPFQPYDPQKCMMSIITRSLLNKQHSLIESPTGTGKTLVLLCAALAWRKKSKELEQPFISDALRKKIAEERMEKLRSKPCTCGKRPNSSELEELKENMKKGKESCKLADQEEDSSSTENDSASKKIKLENTTQTASPYFKEKVPAPDVIVLDDDDDCQIVQPAAAAAGDDAVKEDSTVKVEPQVKLNKKVPKKGKSTCVSCMSIEAEEIFAEILDKDEDDEKEFSTKARGKIPKIYYGTRTHKQITQVIRELKKTTYGEGLKMCILSSRDRTCVNENVKDMANRNDLCQELIKTREKSRQDHEPCPYYGADKVERVFETINQYHDYTGWDIEDAYKFGQTHRACPYYGLRSLQEEADITFCPYNYLIDPNIRQAMNINLKRAVIIFDEAHNIEDVCRDSASYVLDTRQIDDLLETLNTDMKYVLQGSDVYNAYAFIRDKLMLLKTTLMKVEFAESNRTYGEKELRRIWTQSEMEKALQSIGLGPEIMAKFKDHLGILKGGEEDEKNQKSKSDDDEKVSRLSFAQLQSLSQLCLTLGFMYSDKCKSAMHFRAVVTRHLEADFLRFNQRSSHNRQQPVASNTYVWQISLLCMNPGIAFEKITSSAWSIVVASGTLAPIDSLKSELGCTFENVYEGRHVIENQRVFASVLSSGPNRVELNCAFANSLRLDFQDEVGHIVRDICTCTPNGVLCFFSSYDRMENFYQRWFAKGLMMEIERAGKKIFRERKNCSVSEFELELESYNKHARMEGALLFAVFRGKVSEGIDFADSTARAVLTIGVPYPNVKEVTVQLKKEYNDSVRSIKPHLMTGKDWYAAQAFRALNQALGRCIRHKADWGAIIMIDSRLRWGNSLHKISKWIRTVLEEPEDYAVIKASLEKFVHTRMEEDKKRDIQMYTGLH